MQISENFLNKINGKDYFLEKVRFFLSFLLSSPRKFRIAMVSEVVRTGIRILGKIKNYEELIR